MGNRLYQRDEYLKICEEFFRMSTDLFVIADFEGYFKLVSPSWTTSLGYTADELISKKFLDFVHPDDRAKTLREMENASGGRPDFQFVNRYVAKDGSIHWLHWRSNTDVERKVIFASARDITAQKITDEKLRSTNRKLNSLLEAITDGFMSIGSDWRLAYANPKALKLWGKSGGIGKNITETIPDFFGSSLHRLCLEAIKSRCRVEFEEHCKFTGAWIKGTLYPGPQGIAMLVRDVSEQKDFEMKMREQHEMLVQASKFSSLGEMAGEIAHEINTPLAAIMLNVELLSEIECANPEEQIEADRLIKSTSETVARISQIVKGLRSFARDANHEPMVLVSLASIVEDTLALCSPKFKTGRVKIEPFKIDPEFMIECRPVQISQVLLNLLSNAYDAVETLPERWIRIELSDQGESFELAVVDSGPGVNEVLRKRIMEPFFTTKPAGKGTGLGLSISAGILNSHRGGLSVDAACANTRFVMTLPKRQPQALSA